MPIDGVPNSLYAEKLHVVNLLEGNVLLGVQGNFVITDPLPIHFYDAEDPTHRPRADRCEAGLSG